MAWNNAYETKKFEQEQEMLVIQYRNAGMNEQQIQAMSEFDRYVFHNERAFRTHNQPLQEPTFDEDATCDESDNALLLKYLDAFSTTIDDLRFHSRNWWIEEISDPALAARLRALSEDDLTLLSQYLFENTTQKDLAEYYGISQKNISKKIRRIKNFLSGGV